MAKVTQKQKRSEASRKGWETRKQRQAERQALLLKQKRSEASRKGWETRKQRQAERQALLVKQKRSEASRKGWETRKQRQAEQSRKRTSLTRVQKKQLIKQELDNTLFNELFGSKKTPAQERAINDFLNDPDLVQGLYNALLRNDLREFDNRLVHELFYNDQTRIRLKRKLNSRSSKELYGKLVGFITKNFYGRKFNKIKQIPDNYYKKINYHYE